MEGDQGGDRVMVVHACMPHYLTLPAAACVSGINLMESSNEEGDRIKEEVPSWLKELLDDEPETYGNGNGNGNSSNKKGHRRSASDSSISRSSGSKRHYRARKVQYIGELETSIQALQAEGYQVSAELQFLDHQNLILGMENRALKQRLDSLSQEHFIKCLEHQMLEKEITRLRNLYQHQQQHHRSKRQEEEDLHSSFAKLSLNSKGT